MCRSERVTAGGFRHSPCGSVIQLLRSIHFDRCVHVEVGNFHNTVDQAEIPSGFHLGPFRIGQHIPHRAIPGGEISLGSELSDPGDLIEKPNRCVVRTARCVVISQETREVLDCVTDIHFSGRTLSISRGAKRRLSMLLLLIAS